MPYCTTLRAGHRVSLLVAGVEVGAIEVRSVGATRADVLLHLPETTTVRKDAAPSQEGASHAPPNHDHPHRRR